MLKQKLYPEAETSLEKVVQCLFPDLHESLIVVAWLDSV